MRSHTFIAMVVAASVLATAWPAGWSADAAQMCQVGKTKQVRLRAGSCRKKETSLFDTATSASAVADLQARATRTETSLAQTCPDDPTRTLISPNRDTNGLLFMLGYVGFSLCRTLDGNQAACNASFEPGAYGAAACAYVAGKCLTCDLVLDAAGVCRNTCMPALTCADVTRPTRVGSCEDVATQPACQAAFTLSLDYATPTDVVRAASCFWDGAACKRCDPERTSAGSCSNSCVGASDLPVCRAAGHAFGHCSALNGNPAACNMTYELSRYGTQTCWYDVGPGDCNGCDPVAESQGKCTNGC